MSANVIDSYFNFHDINQYKEQNTNRLNIKP